MHGLILREYTVHIRTNLSSPSTAPECAPKTSGESHKPRPSTHPATSNQNPAILNEPLLHLSQHLPARLQLSLMICDLLVERFEQGQLHTGATTMYRNE